MKIDKSKAIHDAVLATAIEEAEERGILQGQKQGLEQGQKEGREQEKRTLVLNLLKLSLPLPQISEASGVDIETLKKWQKELEQ